MSSEEQVVIRNITDEDADFISEAYLKFFRAHEPVAKSWFDEQRRKNQPIPVIPIPAYNKELSLIATLPNQGNKRVGFHLNEFETPDTIKELENEAENKLTGIQQIMCRLFCNFYKKSDIFNAYGVKEVFHFDQLAVDPDYRGRKIGEKLVEHGLELAKKLGYKVAIMEAISEYSSRIALKLGMKCLVDLPYRDYKNEFGEQYVNPPAPHTNARFYVKVLE